VVTVEYREHFYSSYRQLKPYKTAWEGTRAELTLITAGMMKWGGGWRQSSGWLAAADKWRETRKICVWSNTHERWRERERERGQTCESTGEHVSMFNFDKIIRTRKEAAGNKHRTENSVLCWVEERERRYRIGRAVTLFAKALSPLWCLSSGNMSWFSLWL